MKNVWWVLTIFSFTLLESIISREYLWYFYLNNYGNIKVNQIIGYYYCFRYQGSYLTSHGSKDNS